jgi:DNA repair exonuclease SbcCD ATPase subunit
MKFFQKWKNSVNLKKDLEKLEKNINDKYNKLYEAKTTSINKEIKNKQKSIEELKENEKELHNSNKQMEKEKENLLKNEKKLQQKIEQLEKENAQLEKEKKSKEVMTNSNTYQNFFPNKKENNEEKIKELEKKLKELEDEEIERKNYMEEYFGEMVNMMSVFEQKAQEIMRLQNTGHMRRRLEINTGSYDSTNPGSEYNFNETISRNNSK